MHCPRSILLRHLSGSPYVCVRIPVCFKKYGTQPKALAEMDEKVLTEFENNTMKARKHPGVMKISTVELPKRLMDSIKTVLAGHPIKKVQDDASLLERFLTTRKMPVEQAELQRNAELAQKWIEENDNIDVDALNDSELQRLESIRKAKAMRLLRQNTYHWQPVEYSTYVGLQYLTSRFAPEYAALIRIFSEIKKRCSNFKPQTLLDFGSGVGTVTWAAREFWEESLKEYFLVDSSAEMNDISNLLLRDGHEDKEIPLKAVFFRQFLPAQTTVKYDVVVSAYSLFELPSSQSRLETILNLWNKTQGFLIIVEHGTNSGFELVTEARDFILELSKQHSTNERIPKSFIFSPCPHDGPCPRYHNFRTPCNFEVSYFSFRTDRNIDVQKERFSYVVLKKGVRPASDPEWPRIVREVLPRKQHVICRLCTPEGSLQEVIFTPKVHGKPTYRCARSSNWGDLLPMTVTPASKKDDEIIAEDNDQT